MDDYAGRVLADRYRLPLTSAAAGADPGAPDVTETRAFDTYSGQEVLVRQVPLPEFVDAEVLDGADGPDRSYGAAGRATRRPAEPVVRRAIEAAQAAAQIPDHPLLDQVFDVFAEAGSLWIVSEVVAARPLSALLAERPLNPYRAAEIGADVLTALRALHAHGWVHRNITARTVLVCDDGRVVLTGLAVGAAEEALSGYAPVPEQGDGGGGFGTGFGDGLPMAAAPGGGVPAPASEYADVYEAEVYEEAEEEYEEGEEEYEEGEEEYEEGEEEYEEGEEEGDGESDGEAFEEGEEGGEFAPGYGADEGDGVEGVEYLPYEATVTNLETELAPLPVPDPAPAPLPAPAPYGADPYGAAAKAADGPRAGAEPPALPAPPTADVRAARAGAIAAYRAATRAAARLGESGALPVQRPAPAEPGAEQPSAAAPAPVPPSPVPVPPPAPVPASGAPEPQWWSQAADDDDDGDDDDATYGGPPSGPAPRVHLAGNWSDGPHASRDGSGPIPAGGGSVLPGSGRPALPAGYTAATPEPGLPARAGVTGPERSAVPPSASTSAPAYRGPTTRLAAERARQTRIAVVGAVTERWAPEQAGPVHENWRLAPPIGPATDLWALGALLYRAVQGHAPYPEDSAAELVQLVCAEPPAFAEECGPLRPIVESLLRQDPTERPDFEELRGWLRSLVRSAPEPDAGFGAVPPQAFDATRLPIVRRRGELVRRRLRRAGADSGAGRHRHKRGKDPRPAARQEESRPQEPEFREEEQRAETYREEAYREETYREEAYQPEFREEFLGEFREEVPEEVPQRAPRAPRPSRAPRPPRAPRPSRAPRAPRAAGSSRSLGRTLLLVVLFLFGGALAYAVLFMPRQSETPAAPTANPTAPATSAEAPSSSPADPAPPSAKPSAEKPSAQPTTRPPAKPTTPPAAPATGPAPAAGYVLQRDPEGFSIGVPKGWRRSPINDAGQVRYTSGDFTMIVVPGRDSVGDNGTDPLEYQNSKERELEPWRASSWSDVDDARRVDIGTTATATGSYWWLDSTGREVFVRNLALIDGGRYHVVQVIGPSGQRDKVSAIHDEATRTFRPGR
ncbi:protein kinase [Streptomyces sp. NPDC056144]|uniref:protein kinase n=1 Tax=unclassified Streptomyces TaxID=2593676 RepID=UPI0035DCD51C